MLPVEALQRLVAERDRHYTQLELAPGRLADTARQLDTVTARINQLQPRVTKAAVLVEHARAALDGGGGWLAGNRLTRTERAHHQHVLDIVPAQLAIEQADLARFRERHAQLTETLGKWRDYTDQAPARLASMEQTISRDAKARLEQAIGTRQFAPDLARHLINRAGPWPTNPGPARDRWERAVAPVLQHHALTGQLAPLTRLVAPVPVVELTSTDGITVAVYSRAQLQAISTERRDPHVTNPEKIILQQAWTSDAYKRLDHALHNQHDIPANLADHVIERLGPRPANDEHHVDEWDRLVATALSDHAETGTLSYLPDWTRDLDTPDIGHQAQERARPQERGGPSLGR